jgi:hypothetical protein
MVILARATTSRQTPISRARYCLIASRGVMADDAL